MTTKKRVRICFYAGAGGHIRELMFILPELIKDFDYVLITDKKKNTKQLNYILDPNKIYYINYYGPRIYQILFTFISAFFAALKVFFKEKPNVFITTGPEPAIPIAIVAKLFRKKVIYIESICRLSSPSGTARIIYFISDKLYVPYPELINKLGQKAEFRGRII